MRGGRWRYLAVILRCQEAAHAAVVAPSTRDIDHRSHQKAHHVVEKAIRRDLKNGSRFALRESRLLSVAPLGVMHCAQVGVVRRCGAANGERAKTVFADQFGCGPFQCGALYPVTHVPLPAVSERRPRAFVQSQIVAVAAGGCTVSRVKLVAHLERRCHPDIGWKHGIERLAQAIGRPAPGHADSDRLAARMYAGIGTPRAERRDRGGA